LEELDSFRPKENKMYTEWINLIRNAKIRILDPKDTWKDDTTLIQIKQGLSDKDLPDVSKPDDYENETDDNENLHINEKTLDVIKLPMAIPTKDSYPTDQYLFVRPDEYELFLCFGQCKESIMTGNPGISKSWFQWKYILFCFRQDLYNQLWFDDYLKKPELSVQEKELFIPKLIVRTKAGSQSLLFFLQGTFEVLKVFHQPTHLSDFTNKETTILWEPNESKQPVCYDEIRAHIIATVSPNQDRYKEFEKNGARLFYLPCPSKIQLRLMGQIYRDVSTDLNYPTDEDICQRVTKYGPFIRIVCSSWPQKIVKFENQRKRDINDLQNTQGRFVNTLCSPVHITEYDNNDLDGLSHRLARFVVDRDPNSTIMFGFTIPKYELSSSEVINEFDNIIAKLEINDLQKIAQALNRGKELKFDCNKVLEYLFRSLSCSNTGIKWKSYPMKEKSVEQDFVVKFTKVEREITLFENMQPGILYYPANLIFPLVDFYYLDENQTLVGIQATTGATHSKNVTVYNQFFSTLGLPEQVDGNCINFNLYYLILPSLSSNYIKEQYTDGTFWSYAKKYKTEIAKMKQTILFHALVPPDNFGYNYSVG
jgi:hypothetical protein